MSLKVNFNSSALNAYRNLSTSDSSLSKSIERLSSGYKINNAADDPAGLVISEKLRAQVGGLNQAISNAGDAVNMIKTAEGALTQVNSLLGSMRDLAVHASNAGANDTAAVAADQQQIANALASINKISEETQFGQKKLLDGSAGVKTTVTGLDVTGANLNYATTLAATDTVSVNVTTAAAQAKLTGTVDLGTALAADASFNLTGNGTTVAINLATGDDIDDAIAAVNAHTDKTGIVATNDGSDHLVLTSQDYGGQAAISYVGGAGATAVMGKTADAKTGIDAEATVTHLVDAAPTAISDGSWTSGNGTVLQDTLGNTIALTVAAATATGDKGAQVSTESGSLVFQVGAYSGQTREINIASTATADLGIGAVAAKTLADIDVTTASGAQDALDILDKAIADVSTIRANLGATQKNTLESSISSLTVASENISASESTIRDTDMASEMVNFTKYQILQQAGISMLSQANSSGQNLLSLFR
ncbi:MAG: flagellin [Armatimonadota bacterium]